MWNLQILAIAVALAMDALAVALAAGVALKQISARQYFRLVWHFGLFQAMMPVIGWSAGFHVRQWIEAYDHWAAFGLLAFVAQGMLRSAWKGEHPGDNARDPTRGATLVMLSIATSIDALAVGLSLSVIDVSIWLPAAVIGVTAAAFTYAGMTVGRKIGGTGSVGRWAEALGGCILLAIGLNVLHEHGALSGWGWG